uniref:Uncharacterized protein n=1 Tax=Setaria italica TaxID=4555 RepID=K3YD53_SETIT
MEVLTDIADHVAATSFQPMDDLCKLRTVYKVMHRACGDPSIGQCMALLRTYWEDMQWNKTDRYYALLTLLVGVGNPEACTLKGIYICRIECEDGLAVSESAGPKKLRNDGCRVCHEEAAYLVNKVTWRGHGDPLPPAPFHGDFSCAGGDCGKDKGWEQAALFCNEDCRIHHEIVAFERRMGIDN